MSGISLKPVDGGAATEIPTGDKITIGRGPFLKIVDKRVSRNHATLEVNEKGKLVLVPTHTNPCFFKAGGKGKAQPLSRGVPKLLEHKDVVSLLPDDLSYEVIYDLKRSVKDEIDADEEEVKENGSSPTSSSAAVHTSPAAKKTVTIKKREMAMPLDKKRTLPKWMVGAGSRNTPATPSTSKAPTKLKVAENVRPPQQRTGISDEEDENTAKPRGKRQKGGSDENVPAKRRTTTKKTAYRESPDIDELSLSEDEVLPSKKRKHEDSDFKLSDSGSDWESSSKKKGKGPFPRKGKGRGKVGKKKQSDSDDISDEDEYVPKASKTRNKRTTAKKASDSEEEDETSRKKKGKKTKRKPCMYAKKCYRKNPAHFKEYCHPGDDSYEEPEEESEEELPKRTRRPARRQDKKSVIAGASDDDGDANTYDYDDSFIDNADQSDDGGSSSYNDISEDSNWEPDDDDDVKKLVKEAKGFIKNKKMVKPARTK